MKLVVSLRGAHINYSPIADHRLAAVYREFFPKVDGFHAVSKAIAREAMKYGAPSEKIKVVYSGLDTNALLLRSPKSVSDDVLRLLSVGRGHWKKGYSYAIDACKMLEGAIKYEYVIVGGDTEELAFQVHQLNLNGKIKLLSRRSFAEVKKLMESADVLLLPSVEEGLPNVVLEAMALGTPVIATRCGGMEEVIEDGVNGFLVPVRNPAAIAESVKGFTLLTQVERNRVVLAARQTIEERFHSRQMVEGMMGVYGEVIEKSDDVL